MGVPILSHGLSGLPPPQVRAVRSAQRQLAEGSLHSLPEIIRTNGTTGLLRPPPLPEGLDGCESIRLFLAGLPTGRKGNSWRNPGVLNYLPLWGIWWE